MRILIVSDAWHPQVNGVVRSLEYTKKYLEEFGHDVILETPNLWPSTPLPNYNEIHIPFFMLKQLYKKLDSYNIDVLHIATEGSLGLAARRWAHKNNFQYTTAFHTMLPDYIKKRFPFISLSQLWRFEYFFHHKAHAVFVPTDSVAQLLKDKGLKNTIIWARGVDTNIFKPFPKKMNLKSPIWLYVGRMAIEKNIESFLTLKLPGTKLLVGDGPLLSSLKKQYTDALFVGKAQGQELVQYYNEADIFVFPSKTDTFGLVILEALACGKPVAAFNVAGPKDIIGNHPIGYISDELEMSCKQVLEISPSHCRDFALKYDWKVKIREFERNLIDINGKNISCL